MVTSGQDAIIEGIAAVAVGRRGSRACSPDLVMRIVRDLEQSRVDPVQTAVFASALAIKGATEEEARLVERLHLDDPEQMAKELAGDTSPYIQHECARLLRGEGLTRSEARALGDFLFSEGPGDPARALIATVLRVRYTDADEYAGLLQAMSATLAPAFREPPPEGPKIVQLAEPFDGVERSFLLTPLIANWLRERGYRVISLVGESSGPKFGINLRALAQALKGTFLRTNADMDEPVPPFGWYIDQADLSGAVGRWVGLRQRILKRPFLATLERYLNPARADLVLGSAFHSRFSDQTIEIANSAGFRSAIVSFKTTEGTLGLSLGRTVHHALAVRRAGGVWERSETRFRPEDFGLEARGETRIARPEVGRNADLIEQYQAHGSSGDQDFDDRVAYTLAALKVILEQELRV